MSPHNLNLKYIEWMDLLFKGNQLNANKVLKMKKSSVKVFPYC